jgi:tetratricopeptide (TPR) repeat protein
MLMKNQKYSEAIPYLKKGENLEDSDDRADCFLYIAECYRSLNSYTSARAYALKSAGERPNSGNPYIIIGDMYAASSKNCGSNDLENKAVYWVAVDKYRKARQVDPDIKDIANDRINSYSIYFPPKEEIFFYDLNEGDEYIVECWINEKTIIRAAKN